LKSEIIDQLIASNLKKLNNSLLYLINFDDCGLPLIECNTCNTEQDLFNPGGGAIRDSGDASGLETDDNGVMEEDLPYNSKKTAL
jgi:hypothetical protein